MFILFIQSMSSYNPYVSKRSNRANTPAQRQQGGRKKHGSHRSPIIGAYQFKSSPVTELHQAGVIWY